MIFVTLLKKVSRRWIAGETLEEALIKANRANEKGMKSIVNFLGEELTSREDIEHTLGEYIKALNAIENLKLNCSISVKLTQLGLKIEDNYCKLKLHKLIKEASSRDIFVWIDMESSKYTQKTIDIYNWLLEKYNGVGLAIQSYLKRSEADVKELIRKNGKIRLCKGAYKESTEIAYKSKKDIDKNYFKLMKILFESGKFFAIATHDDRLTNEAIKLNKKYPVNFEFQMLMGIRDDLKPILMEAGYRLCEYIPYGRDWLPYSVRRLRERKRNVLLLLRALLS